MSQPSAAALAPAATVILLRNGRVSPEVLLLERNSRSEFLPDMYVFPGGRVEESDLSLADRTGGIDHEEARRALHTTSAEWSSWALGFYVAAIRETFEESGILLARRRSDGEWIEPERARALGAERLGLQDGSRSFRDLVVHEDLELAADQLAVHAHWITPEHVKRRFDTIFFSAVAPAGQLAAHDGVESTDHIWIRPEQALEEGRSGARQIIFPTSCNLETLCGFETAAEVHTASRERPVVAVLPRVEERDGQRVLVIPEAAGYGVALASSGGRLR